MRRSALTISLLALLLPAPFAAPQVDWDRSIDFSRYETFGFREGTPANRLTQDRIESALRDALAEKGLSESDQPDLWVVTHASVSNETWIRSGSTGYGGWGSTSLNVSNIPVGTLMIDLVDRDDDELVWRGVTSGSVKSTPAKSEKQIRKKISKLFRKYPPRATE